jgi:hypothetical protein
VKAYYFEALVNDHIDCESEALEEFKSIVDCGYMLDDEPILQNLAHMRHVDEYKGYDLYYCYGADHYCIGVDEYPLD